MALSGKAQGLIRKYEVSVNSETVSLQLACSFLCYALFYLLL